MKTIGKGFTLVELVVVVMIIGVITFITVPRMVSAVVALGKSNTGAERIAAAIRQCRTLAISNAATNQDGFELGMKNTVGGSYTKFEIAQVINGQTSTVVESGTIPGTLVESGPAKVTCTCTSPGSGTFRFGPLGNRTGGSGGLTVVGGGKTFAISVVTTTGMVKCTQQ